MRYCGRAID